MKSIFLMGFFLMHLTISAQEQLRTEFGNVYYPANMYKTKYDTPEGTPYLYEGFKPAKINDIQETQLVRFNAVEGNVEVVISDTKVVVLDNSKLYNISLLEDSGKVYSTLKYADARGNESYSFFELLDSTVYYKIYLKERKKFYKKVKAQGYADEEPARFKKIQSEFYITDSKNRSDRLVIVPQNMKSFTAFLQDDSKSIKKFIKENKLKIDNPDDLIKIFNFYFEQQE